MFSAIGGLFGLVRGGGTVPEKSPVRVMDFEAMRKMAEAAIRDIPAPRVELVSEGSIEDLYGLYMEAAQEDFEENLVQRTLERSQREVEEKGLKGKVRESVEQQVQREAEINVIKQTFQRAVAWLNGEADEIINRCFSECRDGYRPFKERELFDLFRDQRDGINIESRLGELERQNTKFRTERIHLHISKLLDELTSMNKTFCGYIQKYLGHADFKTGRETFTRLLSVLEVSLKVGDLAKADQEQLQKEAISVLGQMQARVEAVVPFLIELCKIAPQARKELEKLSGKDRTDHANAWIQPAQYPTRVALLAEALLNQTVSTEIKDIVDRLKVVLLAFNAAIPQPK